jgi:apolipoprotein N-acyltransferase
MKALENQPAVVTRPEAKADCEPSRLQSSLIPAALWAAAAIATFHLAYGLADFPYCIVFYLIGLCQIARLASGRQAFYLGLAVGFFTAAPQLICFWQIFGVPAFALWLIIAFWIGLFTALARTAFVRFETWRAALFFPVLWTGLEYFRSELYYLKFSWLNAGYALSKSALLPLYKSLGMYGVGFAAMLGVGLLSVLRLKKGVLMALRIALVLILLLFLQAYWTTIKSRSTEVTVAGMQMEFPSEHEIITGLDNLIAEVPNAELLVLSEYTLDGPPPDKLLAWCRDHARYVIVGGKDPAPKANFYDTAFVIDPSGSIIFKQVKSVPIQFFKDGLPATEQKLWESPWGKIGICICYDLSYTRVTDRLIRLGAQALVVPTMDVVDWGKRQHELHARVAPVRAAEYGVPIFRVASSGISQFVNHSGKEEEAAGFPGKSEIIKGRLVLARPGTLPIDRWLGPLCSIGTAGFVLWLIVNRWGATRRKQ